MDRGNQSGYGCAARSSCRGCSVRSFLGLASASIAISMAGRWWRWLLSPSGNFDGSLKTCLLIEPLGMSISR